MEIEYSPNGVDSGLCIGIRQHGHQQQGVSPAAVRRVGQDRVDPDSRTSRAAASSRSRYVPLINGSDTNFSHPFVLTYPQNANPNDKPRPQLVTQNLHKFSRGQVYDNQQWSAFFGVLR